MGRHNLKDVGDGVQRGTVIYNEQTLSDLTPSSSIVFNVRPWQYIAPPTQRRRESSRYLTRLHLLKELLTVFVNRAASLVQPHLFLSLIYLLQSSFDTKVSLVLSLVTCKTLLHLKLISYS